MKSRFFEKEIWKSYVKKYLEKNSEVDMIFAILKISILKSSDEPEIL